MKKKEATSIRLEKAVRKELEEVAKIAGLPVSACIRAAIVALLKDFKKNHRKVCFPVGVDSLLHIWTAIKEEYAIPPYIDSSGTLENFLAMVCKHDKKG